MSGRKQIEIAGLRFEVIRKEIKSLRLYVLPPDGALRISAPRRLSEASIRSFVLSKLCWIERKREKYKNQSHPAPRNFSDGERICLFGREYGIAIVQGERDSAHIEGEAVVLSLRGESDAARREGLLDEFYRSCLKSEVALLLPMWEEITGLRCSGWQIRNMKTRWGSCTPATGRIRLSLQLAKAPRECLEYVILHELAHLRFANHGRAFKEILTRYMPRWEEIRRMLDV